MMTKIALLQMQSGIDARFNCQSITDAMAEAARGGASILFTPEMALLLDSDRKRSQTQLTRLEEDPQIATICAKAAECNIWVHIGSLALLGGADGRRRNCSVMINNVGQIVSTYDKIHLFDVDLETGESWRESAAYAPGDVLSLVETPLGLLGLSVCYDIRFPALYQALTDEGAHVLAIPAAFTVPTGQAHWHILLRARAIENAAFVVAAAQTGTHEDGCKTYGHSLVVDPWGEIMLDMGDQPGLGFANIDLGLVAKVRARIPVLEHRRAIPQMNRRNDRF
jgi:deaminated glutathione amidase